MINADKPFVGSIPTGVGEPWPGPPSSMLPKVYPHRCGGTTERRSHRSTGTGLSPQVWGNQLTDEEREQERRSIPTGVGEPIKDTTQDLLNVVYPHRCGGTILTAA